MIDQFDALRYVLDTWHSGQSSLFVTNIMQSIMENKTHWIIRIYESNIFNKTTINEYHVDKNTQSPIVIAKINR